MLQTKLDHIQTEDQFDELLANHNQVMLCCGRMGPMCIPVYGVMEEIRQDYPTVRFADMDFDTPVATRIKTLPECNGFMGLPFTVYFKQGKVVKATTSIQNQKQVEAILKEYFD
jgi:thioredoxin 1